VTRGATVAIAILPAWGTGTFVGHLGSVTLTFYSSMPVAPSLDSNLVENVPRCASRCGARGNAMQSQCVQVVVVGGWCGPGGPSRSVGNEERFLGGETTPASQ
jgi:hypothetical protein